MAARVDVFEAKRRLLELYPCVNILEYEEIKKRAKFICNKCGRVWYCRACLIINGISSCKCEKNKKRMSVPVSKERIDKELADRNITLISDYPQTISGRITIRFSCGHIHEVDTRNFLNGISCGTCKKLNFYKNKWTEEKIIELLDNNFLSFIGFIGAYVDGSSKIQYGCADGHITTRTVKGLVKFPTCKQCKIIARGKMQSGSGSSSWKGGVSKIWVAARARLDPWLDRSIKENGRVCFITGQTDVPLDVHHITSFNIILKQVMNEFGFDENYYEKSYAECDGEKFLARVVEVNDSYGLGVVLRKDIHILYHKTYGHGNNTPAQFEEFLSRINSGEITLES
jgi:hypothetical protein